MANTNFIVHNGLSIGPVTVDAATGDMTGVANLVITGSANISSIQNGNSNVQVIANANVTISSTGNANIFTVTGIGANVAGTLGISGVTTASSFVSNIATGTAPFTVTSTTQVANLNVATAGSATTAGTVTTAAQPNITSVGNLTIANIDNIRLDGNTISSTDTNGNINLSPNGTGNVVVNDALIPGANATYTLGNTGAYWSTIYGTATTALYADLAENYIADADYAPGTVVSFGGTQEVTNTNVDMDPRVAGVVSTNPAHLMNGALEGQHVTAVALTGRVPTKIVGPVKKGDLMVSTNDGRARSEIEPVMGSVIGKALENFEGNEGVIEVVIGRV
jgi:hypothetical protein